jgi:hypothetical protein
MSAISLADWLRQRDDQTLAALLRARPDLATPPPADSTVLATRAGTWASVARAGEELDRFTLSALEALVVADADIRPVPMDTIRRLLGPDVPARRADAAIDRLRALAIVWDSEIGSDGQIGSDGETGGVTAAGGLCLVPSAREVVGPHPAGLGAPSTELDGKDVDDLLRRLGTEERQTLNRLAAGSPIGRTKDAAPVAAHAGNSPVRRLLGLGLLVRRDTETVELPRQVGLLLRGDRPLGKIIPTEPKLPTTRRNESTVAAAGAGEAAELVRHTEVMLNLWSADPPPMLRSGGLGVRELRKVARELDGDERRVTLLAELAAGAGLIADSESTTPQWVPTMLADDWLAAGTEHRWATLAGAWLDLPRLPGLAGGRDDKERLLAPLGPELQHPLAARDRRWILRTLAELPEDVGLGDPAGLVALLAWRAPRRGGRLRDDLVRWTLSEGTTIGLLAIGALTPAGRALLAEGPPAAAKRLAAALPEPVDHVLVQADLTVVAPGPLERSLANEIALVADVESAGGATVYRVSEASVRRALDAGRSALELHELFGARSRTPVPQSLSYLIDDVARRHGRLRGGSAGSFLRCDDEVLLTELLANSVSARLELRRIAPTVLVAPVPLIDVLDELRAAGFTPVAEGTDGQVLDVRPAGRRIAARPKQDRRPSLPPVPNADRLAAVVRQLRVGDEAAAGRRDRVSAFAGGTGSPLAVLRDAVRAGQGVWLSFVDAHGVASERFVTPLRIGGGMLEGQDRGSDEVHRFPLHRITKVEVASS